MQRALVFRTGGASRFHRGHVGPLHYFDIPGRGALGTVVLLHGASQGGVHYAGVIHALRDHYGRVIVPDAPGHGSSVVPADMRADVLTDALTDLLDQVLAGEQAVVFGTSLGGAMALHYGMRSPERVSQLCLLSPAGAPLSPQERQHLMELFEMPRQADARAFMQLIAHRPSVWSSLVAVETRRRFRAPPMRDLFESFTSGADEFTAEDVRALEPPVRLLWGRREQILPASNLAFFKEHLPQGRVVVEPPHFAHAAFLEYPQEVAGHVIASGRAAKEAGIQADASNDVVAERRVG